MGLYNRLFKRFFAETEFSPDCAVRFTGALYSMLCVFKKNLNASKPSEHPPQVEECLLLFFNFGFGQTIYTGVSSGPANMPTTECLSYLKYSPTTHCSVRNAKIRIEIGANGDKIC